MFRITPAYDLLLRGSDITPVGLYQLYMATAAQIAGLHYKPGSINKVKARFKNLTDHGFVLADAQPTKKGNGPYFYTLSQQGMRYLRDIGYDTSETFRANREVSKHTMFVNHTLELNDLLIAAIMLKTITPTYYLDSFTHERALKRRPYKVDWRDEAGSHTFTIIPDAFLDFRVRIPNGRDRTVPLLLEHDRGTEEKQHFRRRIRAYSMFLKSGAYRQHFGVGAITVVFTTFAGVPRLKQMIEWTRAELGESQEARALGATFSFTALDPSLQPQIWLDKRWYTPYLEDGPQTLLSN